MNMFHCLRFICLYPYSTLATNWSFIYSGGGGGGGGSKKISNRDALRVSPDSDTMSLRISGGSAQLGLNRARIHYD